MGQIHVPKAAELVAEALRRSIIDGSVADGEMLPSESQLMQQFNVSRPTLREAIRILERERLITVRRGARGGAVVLGMQQEVVSRYAALLLESRGTSLSDIYEAQAIIEPACVARLAEQPSPLVVERLRKAIAEEASRLGSDDDWAERVGFHATLIELSGNETLRLVSAVMRDVLIAIGGKEPGAMGGGQALDEHRLLVDMIEARNREGARRLWTEHLRTAAEIATRQAEGPNS
jgi:DNA-binding FadR family transcriptional regulator